MPKMDDYRMLLEKRASLVDGSSIPDIDNQKVGIEEQQKNLGDNRQTLGNLFTQMGPATRAETSLNNRLFKKDEKMESAAPLLKVAAAVFSDAGFAEHSPSFQMVALHSFQDELEKIAAGEEKKHQHDKLDAHYGRGRSAQ